METKAIRSVRLISCARHIYRDRSLSIDDPFDASENDAEDLIAIGFARAVPDIAKRTYKRRDMEAEK